MSLLRASLGEATRGAQRRRKSEATDGGVADARRARFKFAIEKRMIQTWRASVAGPVNSQWIRYARQPALSWRAAASAVSSGRVLNAITASGAALWMMLTTVSNSARLFGGILRPPPITTQS